MGRMRDSARKLSHSPESPQNRHWKRPPSSPKSLQVIARLKEAGKEAHLKAKNTKTCYKGHVNRGRQWLAQHFSTTSNKKHPPTPDDVGEEDMYADPLFPHAFDRVPNGCSDKALALFLTYKGFDQKRSKGTVEGIRAAFKDLWDNVDGDRYRGRWRFNQLDPKWEGNPANSAEVDDIMSSLKHMVSSEDGDRKHSLPMSKDFMDRMLSWSMEACPTLDAALNALRHILNGTPPSDAGLQMDLVERALVTRHLEQIAFDATAWVLWTRCFELVKLRRRHIMVSDSAAVNHVLKKCLAGETLVLSDQSVSFDIHLRNRKGWQRRVDKGQSEADLRGNHYMIFPQPALPGSDCFLWLLVWMRWLEAFHYERAMEPDDCVFPAMGANGIVQPREQLSHDAVQKWINEATTGAGIMGSFSTHCFRRGGAQYRFMFAPVGERWPLSKIRWWGGWAEQERRDTLIRYLLDELHNYESDYSDALAPTQRNTNESLMEEGTLVRPVSTEEMRSFHTSVVTNVRGLTAGLDGVTNVIRDLTNVVRESHRPTATTTTTALAPLATPTRPSTLTIKIPARRPGTVGPMALPVPANAGTGTGPLLPRQSTSARMGLEPVPVGDLDAPPRHSKIGAHRRASRPIPKPGLVIPDVPVLGADRTRRPRKESWRDIVKHWVSGDPELGLDTPLSQWPPTWTQGNNRVFAVKYYERSVIALEYLNTYGSDEARFLAAYPQAERGHTALLHAIYSARRERGDTSARPRRNGKSTSPEVE
ncbi:hypothetical protein L210DRAFT_3644249 [Boletus edulis BED1]|uniref:Uncharacterized protein n=1 Tax=Boletus edulis BED1 TaxID=1328754 RepID=A0AAD4BXU4_BOLED|nr:hypothetical protein L210DRAFT_3644249 [Boletus edulis BED1]